MVGATLPSYPFWVGGTLVGVLVGDSIGDPGALGLDALFPAFFLGLLIGGRAADRPPHGRRRAARSRHRRRAAAVRPAGRADHRGVAAALIGLAPERPQA